MYERFYGFNEKPFNLTPDSKFFYPSKEHEEALARLIYAVNEKRGFAVITGEIGAGKTTLWRTLISRFNTNTKTAIITNTFLTGKQLIMMVLEEFGVKNKDRSKAELLKELNNYLIRQLSLGYNVVLIIDEAQNLRSAVLEEIRMLSNLETEKEKLLQIVLLGQPELKNMLHLKELEQLKQRIDVCFHIYPLSEKETKEYIYHRLKVASSNSEQMVNIFNLSAVSLIYKHSHGIPRLINMVCDQSLLNGYLHENKEITEEIVQEAISDLNISVV